MSQLSDRKGVATVSAYHLGGEAAQDILEIDRGEGTE